MLESRLSPPHAKQSLYLLGRYIGLRKMKTPLDCLKSRKTEDYPRPLKALIELNKEKKLKKSREKLAKYVKP